MGDRGRALEYYELALPIRREVGDRAGEAATLNNISAARFQDGDLPGAKDAIDASLALFRAVGDLAGEAMCRFNMAVLLSRMNQIENAVAHQRQAVDLAERTSHPGLGQMRWFLHQLEQAAKE